ncbi:MAG: DUF4251 domain-containing protein [Eudoraea sp.]|nr:DUF4251 domain-containing protein [Eudoraea sp.]
MKNFTFVLCLVFCIQTQGQKKADTTEKANAQYESTKELITSGNFLFVADRAMLMGGGSVSMVTNFNQLMFREGKADISLPYFGTVWGGGGYSHKPVIKYEGVVENYELDFNDKKRKIQLKFDLKSGSEIHNVVMTIRRRAYTSVHVKSSGRSSITYDGYTKPIPEAQ